MARWLALTFILTASTPALAWEGFASSKQVSAANSRAIYEAAINNLYVEEFEDEEAAETYTPPRHPASINSRQSWVGQGSGYTNASTQDMRYRTQ